MPKPGSKLRLRLIDPTLPSGATINNSSAYIWVSLVEKFVYATGKGPTYQKKTMSFDNSMEDVDNKSERKVKNRRVTHKARGLYPDDAADGADEEDRDFEYIDVEDIQEFSIREERGLNFQKTTFVMDNPDGIATSRESANPPPNEPDKRKTHRVRIYKQVWLGQAQGDLVFPRWYGVDIAADDAIGVGVPHAFIDIERIDEFTTTTQVGTTYQKTHWSVKWDDEDENGRLRDAYKDEKFDKFLFGANLDQPPDARGDPTGTIEEENDLGVIVTKTITTDTTLPGTGKGWRLDPFQTIVNVRWFYQEDEVPHILYFYWLLPAVAGGPAWRLFGKTRPPFEAGVYQGNITNAYEVAGYGEEAVIAAAAVNDNTVASQPGNFSFAVMHDLMGLSGRAAAHNRAWLAVPYFVPED